MQQSHQNNTSTSTTTSTTTTTTTNKQGSFQFPVDFKRNERLNGLM